MTKGSEVVSLKEIAARLQRFGPTSGLGDCAQVAEDAMALLALTRDLRDALTELVTRHEGWEHGCGPCICKQHDVARAVLARVTETP